MTSLPWILLAAAGVAMLVDWFAVARRRTALEYVAKPGVIALLIGVAVTTAPTGGPLPVWFLAGLACALVGDILLVGERWFLPGLAAFLGTQLCYLAGLAQAAGSTTGLLLGAGVVALALPALGGPLLRAVSRGPERVMTVPVAVYMLVVSGMVLTAAWTGSWLALAGALLLYLSDTILGFARFVRRRPWSELALTVTYHLGQAMLVLALPGLV